ncbi:MAG: hypothetical protein LBU41_02510 [Clostridiales Family XIII bacterium]|jgi:amino acid permease|nr:hypothetical protein [Clostridiales Family XIII bacterium]
MGKNKLSSVEATLLITGSGLGTGILAIPYFVVKMGLIQAMIALLFACMISIISHLMIADLTLHSKNSEQLLGMFQQHLFSGDRKNLFSKIFFLLLFIMLLLNLALYVTCAAEILHETFGLNYYFSEVLFYAVASGLVALGIKSIGVSEKISMVIIAAVVLSLGILTLPHRTGGMLLTGGTPSIFLSLYAMCMFSFSAVFSVPQVVHYIKDKTKIRRCIILGIACNATITLSFSLIVAFGVANVTKVATIGLSDSIGTLAKTLSAIFVTLAMLTSYLSIALAQIQVVRQHTGMKMAPVWCFSTVPTLLMAVLLPLSYHAYIELVGGVFAIIIATMALPSYFRSVRGSDKLLLGVRTGKSKISVMAIFFCYLLMAAGALIPVS